ncbi:MAG: serine/threonine protein phosphatase [Desulfovibrio sp.]|jgi:hypothetical protein|nr:serine/threonine protein phosphatase [Desulfovibrio sp.]
MKKLRTAALRPVLLGFCVLLASCVFLCATASDALWATQQTRQTASGKSRPGKTTQKQAHARKTPKPKQEKAGSVYDDQPGITDEELRRFLQVLPQFRNWCRENNERPRPVVRDGKADFAYSGRAADWVHSRGWRTERFFCVMGRLATALVIVEEGNDLTERPRDMPDVSNEDLELTRRHLGTILKALDQSGENTPPINR